MLPIANKPILYYCIEKLIELNITEIGIVINKSQKKTIAETIGSGKQWGVQISYIFQEEPQGIAHAVRKAKHFMDSSPFILLLGDNLITESLAGLKNCVEQQNASAALLLATVKNPQDYGIAEVTDNKIIGLEEKPHYPKSNLAVLGAYAFDSTIFTAIDSISPSRRNEYEITDAIQWLIDHDYTVNSCYTDKPNTDVGTIERMLEANRWVLEIIEGKQPPMDNSSLEDCVITPPVVIGDGCKLKHCVIGPHVSIGSNVHIEGCEVANSIILDHVRMKHLPYPIKATVIGAHSILTGLPRN
jgi:glucose-1-phosphate thymidylyltransferase